jgi:hypothetical protein
MEDAASLVLGVAGVALILWVAKSALDTAWRNRRYKTELYEEIISYAVAFAPDILPEQDRAAARANFVRTYYLVCLVGSPAVVKACKRFLDIQSTGGGAPQLAAEGRLKLSQLILSMRRDLSLFANLVPPVWGGLTAADLGLARGGDRGAGARPPGSPPAAGDLKALIARAREPRPHREDRAPEDGRQAG